MPARSALRSTLVLAVATALIATAAATAADSEVALRMRGGGFEVKGELKAFDGRVYVIDAKPFGTLALDATRYECVGAGCDNPSLSRTLPSERPMPGRVETLTIAAADTIADTLLPALIRGYAASIGAKAIRLVDADPASVQFRLADPRGFDLGTIEVQRTATAGALGALANRTAALAFTDRPASDAEVASSGELRAKLRSVHHQHVVAGDAVAVIVAHDNPVVSLPLATIAKIFAGQIGNWVELGHAPAPIRVHVREAGAGSLDAFERVVMRGHGVKVADSVTRHASEAALADAVARDPQAIGFAALSHVRSARPVNLATACGLIVAPSPFTVRTEEYPLARRLYAYSTGAYGAGAHSAGLPEQLIARGLLKFATSPEARSIATEQGLIEAGAGIVASPFVDQSARMANALNAPKEQFDMAHMRAMIGELERARRLSLTVRIADGSIDLDPRAREAAATLAQLMQTPEYKGRRVVVAGYTDQSDKLDKSLARSARRAEMVRAAVLAAGGQRLDARLIVARGYGPLAPLACNDTPEGRRLNRRIEVWVRD